VKTERILGLDFATVSCSDITDEAMKGRLVIAPSAPVLVGMAHDPVLRDAVTKADVVLPDSGLMVLLWKAMGHFKLRRVSGLAFLREFIRKLSICQANLVMWVLPNEKSLQRTLKWFHKVEMPYGEHDCYIAPAYSKAKGMIEDPALLERIREQKPHYVVICVGGLVQEELAAWLKPQVPPGTAIFCTGAALAFLTGDQGPIPPIADRLLIGWLLRCIADPVRFIPRYIAAARLIPVLLINRRNLPRLRGE
jgi:UDP-N-acetyl-D-mannosaminuronic acid transferase (WecB/TagA/CpsF family)